MASASSERSRGRCSNPRCDPVPIVYVETNYLIGLTLGQEPDGEPLLQAAEEWRGLELAIPTICFMEAAATIRARVKDWKALYERLVRERKELERNAVSESSRRLLDPFLEASVVSLIYIDGLTMDFRQAVRRLGSIATLIPMSREAIGHGFSDLLVPDRRYPDLVLPDNLILHCILDHAKNHPGTAKAFLSGNRSEFGRTEAREALRSSGIDKDFTDAKNARGWVRSRPVP